MKRASEMGWKDGIVVTESASKAPDVTGSTSSMLVAGSTGAG